MGPDLLRLLFILIEVFFMKITIFVPEYAYVILKHFALLTGRSIEDVSSAFLVSCAKSVKEKGFVKNVK